MSLPLLCCVGQAVDAEYELLDEKENVHQLQNDLQAQVCDVLESFLRSVLTYCLLW